MERDFNNQKKEIPEQDRQQRQHKTNTDLDSRVNTDFKSKGYMKSQTYNEDPETDPNTVPDKPGFNSTQE